MITITSHFHHPFQLSKLSSCRDRRKDIKLLNLNLLSLFLEDWIDRVVTTQSILYHYSEKIHLWIFSQCLQDRRPKMTRLKLFVSCSRGKALIIIPSETRPNSDKLFTLLAFVPWWLSPFRKHSVDLGSITLNFLSLLVVANKDPFLKNKSVILENDLKYLIRTYSISFKP